MSLDLAIAGKQGSGKTHLADAFTTIGWERVSIAAPIKGLVFDAFPGLAKDEVVKVGSHTLTIREVYQGIGRAVREQVGSDFWLKIAVNRIENFRKRGKHIVIDDVRTPFEADYLRARGFSIIRLSVPRPIREQRIGTLHGEEDLTEVGVDMIAPDYDLTPAGIETMLRVIDEASWTLLTPRFENAVARVLATLKGNEVAYATHDR